MADWFALNSAEWLPTPALVVDRQRVQNNIRRMVEMVPRDRLWPHVKTHKMSAIVKLQLQAGITRFKCATLAEAAMVARCAAPDAMLAAQPVGPAIGMLRQLSDRFPATSFSTIVDDAHIVEQLAHSFLDTASPLQVFLDIDNGMHRTGLPPVLEPCLTLARQIANQPQLLFAGLHVYDGHIHDTDLNLRTQHCTKEFRPVTTLMQELEQSGVIVRQVVAGGTPTLAIHARFANFCSPGTCILWDAGYHLKYPDLDFQPAAIICSRVVSRQGNRICLDVGHKAVAADPSGLRIHWLSLPNSRVQMHNEEHLVLTVEDARGICVGDLHYGIPTHICPTVALHSYVWVREGGEIVDRWRVDARDRLSDIGDSVFS